MCIRDNTLDCASQFLVGNGQRHRASAVALTYPFRRRPRAKFYERECDWSPGMLARVRGGGSSPISGRLVQVVRRLRTLSATFVAAALDTHSRFAVMHWLGWERLLGSRSLAPPLSAVDVA